MIPHEVWVPFVIAVWIVALRILCPQCIRERPLPATPDPIEVEARRLAEIEINEFCSLFEEALGLVPAKKTVVVNDRDWTPEQRRDYIDDKWSGNYREDLMRKHLSTPVESMSDARYAMPLILQGPSISAKDAIRPRSAGCRGCAKQIWMNQKTCFCNGCQKWHGIDDIDNHTHVYNACGDVVYSFSERATVNPAPAAAEAYPDELINKARFA